MDIAHSQTGEVFEADGEGEIRRGSNGTLSEGVWMVLESCNCWWGSRGEGAKNVQSAQPWLFALRVRKDEVYGHGHESS
jgi:hypothetical protein